MTLPLDDVAGLIAEARAAEAVIDGITISAIRHGVSIDVAKEVVNLKAASQRLVSELERLTANQSEGEARMFPMQHGPALPWAAAEVIFEAYRIQHGDAQSMEKMAARGGFGWAEVQVMFNELAKKHPKAWARLTANNTSLSKGPRDVC